MNIVEFNQTYPNLILQFRKETPRSPPFRSNKFTTTFINWLLQERNIRIICKGQNIEIPESYNHIPEFILNFYDEHTYFTRDGIIYEYKQKFNPPEEKYRDIKLEFGAIIRHHIKIDKIEKYSRYTYKINKSIVS